MNGYHGRILHVQLEDRSTYIEEPDNNFYRLYAGGGLLGTYYLLKQTPAGIDPFSPENLLIFSNSVVAGYPAAGLVRYIVTSKSPLTNGVGETRCEGSWAVSLKKSGFDAIIFHGKASSPTGFMIADGHISFFDATNYWGKTVGETTDTLEQKHGVDIDVAAIGIAGENQVRFASIISSRTHQAQRMGMGAVMGSKKLKAIVLSGGKLPPIADSSTYQRINTEFELKIPTNILSSWQKELPGFAVWVHTHGLDAALVTENFRTSSFDSVENYRQDNWLPLYRGVAPCPGCANDCMKIYHADDDLDARASAMHQEVTGTLGPNIGTSDIESVMQFNNLCNQWGLDPVSLGFTLSFAMEAFENGILTQKETGGLELSFGNHEAAMEMTRKIVHREGIGDILAQGSQRASQLFGSGSEKYAMQVKGLELVPFEPRSQTNLALGYATAPIGPRYDICEHDWDYDVAVGWDHTLVYSRTLGILDRVPMEFVGQTKVRNYKALNNLWSAADALGFCIFAIAPTRVLSLPLMTEMLAAITGWETSSHELIRWGERRNHIMRIYNNREGMTAADDDLPDRFFEEPINSGAKKGVKIDRTAFHNAIKTYYEMMGWDDEGHPRLATLIDHHLEWTTELKYC